LAISLNFLFLPISLSTYFFIIDACGFFNLSLGCEKPKLDSVFDCFLSLLVLDIFEACCLDFSSDLLALEFFILGYFLSREVDFA